MKIRKTVGQPGENGKDYVIHTECGHEFLAERNATADYQQVELNIHRSTLSGIKQAIEALDEYSTENANPVDFESEPEPEPEPHRTVFEQGPRAASLLALLHVGEHVSDALVHQCLDNAGYIDPVTRAVAVDTARRDIELSR